MAAIEFLLFLLQSLLHVQGVGDELDEATQERMHQRALYLNREMTRLLQEIELRDMMEQTKQQEQMILEHIGTGWGALLFVVLLWFLFFIIAGVLLLVLFRCLRKRIPEPPSSRDQKSSDTEQEKDEESDEEDQEPDGEKILAKIFSKRVQWHLKEQAHRSQVVRKLVEDLIHDLQLGFSKSYWPELQQPIGVGAAFEGWSPYEDEPVYCLLVPLKPPRGYVFNLGLDSTGEIPAQQSCVLVQPQCIYSNEEAGCQCFVHHLIKKLRRRPPGLKHIASLCTGHYLDVQKTASWFRGLLSLGWAAMPQSRQYGLKLLPSARSCMLQLTSGKGKTRGETFLVEIIFGLQKDNSDIFLSSEATEAVISPSTTWRVSSAVADSKIFRGIAAMAPCGSYHLKCLHACTSILAGTSFSTHIMKTIVMHLLTTIPLSHWRDRDFVPRLQDIMEYLRSSLKEKRLNHFFTGNENVPEEINLPVSFRRAEPCNLFHQLAHDPAAHAQALQDFEELQDRLGRLLFYGQ